MKTYKILDPIMLSFNTPQDQYDAIYIPAKDRTIECDESTIWFCDAGKRTETITGINAIELWLNTGRIVEIKEDVVTTPDNEQPVIESAPLVKTVHVKPYIKFTYFKDTESPRTVTAARMLDGDKMYIDWCVNHMNKQVVAYQWNDYVPLWDGDVFDKVKARNIARSRILQKRYCVTLKSEGRKLEQMIDWLLENTANHVQRIIRNAIVERKRVTGGLTFNTQMTTTGRFKSQ